MSNDPNRQDADELDAQLRGAMAALDRATPEVTFEGLLDRALARIDDPAIGELVVLRAGEQGDAVDDADGEREDLRALASETKARLTSRRSSQDLTRSAEDARTSASSASSAWKSVAMPAPVRVVELPKPAEVAAAVPPPPPRRKIRPMVGGLGVVLAAAAGAVIVVTMRQSVDTAQAPMSVDMKQDERQLDKMEPLSAGAAVANAGSAVRSHPDPVSRPAAVMPTPTPTPAPKKIKGASVEGNKPGYVVTKPSSGGKKSSDKKSSPGLIDNGFGDDPADPDKTAQVLTPAPAGNAGSGSAAATTTDPVDAVLHDAAPKKPAPPKLGRSSLSADDIKRGMTAVEPRAKACFAGTAGLVSVRLSVSPSGQVERLTVTGPFAGTPVAACVERAVRAAAFPAWDGAPQSFNYSYLLSD